MSDRAETKKNYSWFGRCESCGDRANLAYEPGSRPPRKICLECYRSLTAAVKVRGQR